MAVRYAAGGRRCLNLQSWSVVEAELGRRYGSDYQVLCAGSGNEALRVLASLRERDRPVAIVLAGQRLPEMAGTDLLGRVRDVDRTIKRPGRTC